MFQGQVSLKIHTQVNFISLYKYCVFTARLLFNVNIPSSAGQVYNISQISPQDGQIKLCSVVFNKRNFSNKILEKVSVCKWVIQNWDYY